ncbi:MAG TPA: hypothetical protein LFW21_03390 [Rickettsia endosymbiont of Pyrocoelia pectoralis]|nr:hypothetical protein [Rickettsia endosymbiont of Pyrocoelia pectoralis]
MTNQNGKTLNNQTIHKSNLAETLKNLQNDVTLLLENPHLTEQEVDTIEQRLTELEQIFKNS